MSDEREHRLTASNCVLAQGKGYPISTGNICFACKESAEFAPVVSVKVTPQPNAKTTGRE